jgi:hypothetical protein
MRCTQTCRGPMTSTVAQNSSDEPAGHIGRRLILGGRAATVGAVVGVLKAFGVL